MRRNLVLRSAAVLIAALACVFAVRALLEPFYLTPVLMYHHIDGHSRESKLSVSPESFERQLDFFKKHGYRVLSLDAYVAMLKSGKRPGGKSVVLTFDDGYDDNSKVAAPLLKKMGFPATFFIQVDGTGRSGYMTESEVRELPSFGVTIGSHTVHHGFLPGLSPEKRDEEIVQSKRMLEERYGVPVKLFSYPGGGFDADARQRVIDAGYEGAVATHPGPSYPHRDPYALKRIRISRTADNPVVLWLQVSGYYTYLEEIRG